MARIEVKVKLDLPAAGDARGQSDRARGLSSDRQQPSLSLRRVGSHTLILYPRQACPRKRGTWRPAAYPRTG